MSAVEALTLIPVTPIHAPTHTPDAHRLVALLTASGSLAHVASTHHSMPSEFADLLAIVSSNLVEALDVFDRLRGQLAPISAPR